MLALYVHLSTYLSAVASRVRDDERGQASAEYALVLLGAAAVALLVTGWAATRERFVDDEVAARVPAVRAPDAASRPG